MLHATRACNFSSLIWPAASAPAALASLLFDPPEPQIIGKTQCFATFKVSRRSYLFAHLRFLFSDLVSSDSSHLCFSTVHIVGSFTSKLPSDNLQKSRTTIGFHELCCTHTYANIYIYILYVHTIYNICVSIYFSTRHIDAYRCGLGN